ncbi:MAG: hypothetical protein J6R47_06620 [Acholeplasmatales bacterium]|nr:hypothetical protein [Acholeplasmatales bacterium]
MNSKEIIKNKIAGLEDDYQHYTMVDKDKVKAHFIKTDIEEHQQILQALERKEELQKENQELKKELYDTQSHYEILENFTVPNLRKVIKILVNRLGIRLIQDEQGHFISISTIYICNEIPQEEYEMVNEILNQLKEVEDNGKNK